MYFDPYYDHAPDSEKLWKERFAGSSYAVGAEGVRGRKRVLHFLDMIVIILCINYSERERKYYKEGKKNQMRYEAKDCQLFTESAETVAQWLLGKWLCSKSGRFRITETEAYFEEDPACYGHDTKDEEVTKAMRPLFGPKGVCLAFGGMLLVTCGREGKPDNVLIRCAGNEKTYCDGAWKVYKALWTKGTPRSQDLITSDVIWLEDDGAQRDFCKTKRVRVTKGRKNEPLRFIAL